MSRMHCASLGQSSSVSISSINVFQSILLTAPVLRGNGRSATLCSVTLVLSFLLP